MLVPQYDMRLSAAEQQALEALPRAGKTPQQTVRRVHLVLLAQEPLSNQASADAVGTSRTLVQKWRKRFALCEPSSLVAATAVALYLGSLALPTLAYFLRVALLAIFPILLFLGLLRQIFLQKVNPRAEPGIDR